MTLTPPGIAHRWTVLGHTPDHWECTIILDLPTSDSEHVTIHPAGVTKYTITADRTSIRRLHDAINTRNVCAIPVHHPVHGPRLLCLRPVERSWTERPADEPPTSGPVMLYLTLPDSEITIIFRGKRRRNLATALSEILLTDTV